MPDKNIELFTGSKNDERSPGDVLREVSASELYACILDALESGVDPDDLLALVGKLRRNGHAEYSEYSDKLDHHLLQRISRCARAIAEAKSAYDEMREKLLKFLQPPLFSARYLGSVPLESDRYALVSHNGGERVVAIAGELQEEQIRVGDELYLCKERNAVIGKAPHRQQECGETASVVRPTGDGRIVLSDRDSEVVVLVGGELAGETLRAGDLVLWDRSARIALGRLETGGKHGYEDIDGTARRQLGGMGQVQRNVLDRFVLGIRFPDIAENYGIRDGSRQRLLLQGPPGTGKTTLMRIVAARIAEATGQRCRIVTISGAELYSPYVGETERNIRRCFAVLRDYEGPGIAFFDEIDSIGRTRGHVSGFHEDRFLGTLLAELEGMQRSDVTVIASTNRADMLDPALRGRFSWEIEVPRPNMAAARQICSLHMPDDIPYRPNGRQARVTRRELIEIGVSSLFDPNADNMIASLQFRDGGRREVAARELVSGRLIEQMCVSARTAAFQRQCEGGEAGLVEEDMLAAAADVIARLRLTLTRKNVKSYLADIEQDLDVVSVESLGPRFDTTRYRRAPSVQSPE